MSERERWIVYPLLFLALGAALRDKLVDRTMSKSIVCQEITVVDEEPIGGQPGRVLAKIGRSQSPGRPSRGFLYLDGELEVVDQIGPGRQPLQVLVARTQSPPDGATRAIVTVSGLFNVNGVVNANQYAIQGQSFLHVIQRAIQQLIPVPLGEFFRAVQQRQAAGSPDQPADDSDDTVDSGKAAEPDRPASPPDAGTSNERDYDEDSAPPQTQ